MMLLIYLSHADTAEIIDEIAVNLYKLLRVIFVLLTLQVEFSPNHG